MTVNEELTQESDLSVPDLSSKNNAVLWRLAYAFLRLEQLPSGGWARSLPKWYQTLKGDTEEGRSRGFELRKIGGMNLTCLALLNYTRSLCSVLGKRPEDYLIRDSENQSTDQSFNLKNIRTLLNEGFTDDELRRLCYDVPGFRPVYDQLSHTMGKSSIIDILIEHAERRILIETLLEEANKLNPRRYEKHQPYRDITANPTISSGAHAKSQRAAEFELFLKELGQIERLNEVGQHVIGYIQRRINTEGAIPDQWERNPDTDVHHTLLGIIVLLLAYFLSARHCKPSFYLSLVAMCKYLKKYGPTVRLKTDARRYEIYCALKFLDHLLMYDFFKTEDPDACKELRELPEILVKIRQQVCEGGVATAYPDIDINASGFLMNLPLLWSLSGYILLETNFNFTIEPLSDIRTDAGSLLQCTLVHCQESYDSLG